jgi:hypothetical protein
MRIERLIPCPPRDLWRALITDTELAQRGAALRLAFPGGTSPSPGTITVYESQKTLECVWGGDVLRWEVHARNAMTLLVFTHAEDCTQWRACLDRIEELATASVT